MVRFVAPRPGDLDVLAENLREEDRVECILATGRTYLSPSLVENPWRAFSIVNEHGDLLAMCGAGPSHRDDVGSAWFLATPGIADHSVSLIRQAPMHLDILAEPYEGGLAAALWSQNIMHLRWARAVGFEAITTTTLNDETFILILRE